MLSLEDLPEARLPRPDRARLPLRSARAEPLSAPRDWLADLGQYVPRPEPSKTLRALARGRDLEVGPFVLRHDRSRVALLSDGIPKWAIDVDHFVGPAEPEPPKDDQQGTGTDTTGAERAGEPGPTPLAAPAPTVTIVPTEDGVEIILSNAFYPGTTIPASLRARIFPDNGVWMLRLRLKYGGFDDTLPLIDWLDGSQIAASAVDLDLECCPLGPASGLAARGSGQALFTPDWLLASLGPDLLRLEGFGGDLTGDLSLFALVPDSVRFLLPTTMQRTAIWIASDVDFPLRPEFSIPAPRVELDDFRFESVAIEAGLEPGGDARRVLFAQGEGGFGRPGLEPGGDLRATDGGPFGVPLDDPRYVQVFENDRTRSLAGFVAVVAKEPSWMHTAGLSVLVNHSTSAPNTILLQLGDQPPLVVLRLALHRTAPRVEGMLVHPREAPPRSELLFAWLPQPDGADTVPPIPDPLPRQFGTVAVDTQAGDAKILLPRSTHLAVVRRDDFLALGYEWANSRLEARGVARSLRPDGSDTPLLGVVFQPQSVGEETFFEVDDDYPVGDSDAVDKSEPPTMTPSKPPVKALLAKDSRLVFALPAPDGAFAVSAESLLEWNDLEPSLAANALPGAVRAVLSDGRVVVLPGPEPPFLQRRLVTIAGQPLADSNAGAPDAAEWSPDDGAAGGSRFWSSRAISILGNRRPLDIFRVPWHIPPRPQAPTPAQTQIELPFRLILSPNVHGAWIHSLEPVTRGDRTELWHTRLGVRSGGRALEGPHVYRTVRAIWSRDHDIPQAWDYPYLMPLDQDDRRQIVDLTSDFSLHSPKPVTVNRLMLSSLGGWLDSDYRHPPPTGYAVEQWRHRATLGRDHYVRVVYKGFMFPCGHRASLVKISERKVEPTPDGDPAAYLRQRMFLVIREPERTYTGSGYTHGAREIPFKRIRITTLVTPNLDPPGGELSPDANVPMKGFWPRVAQKDFEFHLKARDWEGNEVDFLMPLAFIRSDVLADENQIATAVGAYNQADVARRQADFDGQSVAFADPAGGFAGKTTFDTTRIRFEALAPANNMLEPPTYPKLQRAEITLATLRQMTGSNDPAVIELAPEYLEHGFDETNNKAGLFAQVPGGETPAALDYKQGQSADRAGGVATPSLQIRGLSRELGTVGEKGAGFAAGNFDPQQFFAGLDADLFGGISLREIIAPLAADLFSSHTPKQVTTSTADQITTTMHWETDQFTAVPPFEPAAGTVLALDTILATPKAGGSPTHQLEGSIIDFSINLAGAIRVEFEEFRFTSVDGKKPDVHVVITDIQFLGPLAFLAALQDILSPGNFVDPPFIDVSPAGITAGFNLTIPTVAVGVFSLQNLALGARLTLPFIGDPMRLRFNISERQSPFIVTVGPFGGGGFFALGVGIDGVEALEASLEFGGNIAIDLGVASGGIYLMAGIYFQIDVTADIAELTGYVRAGGALEVLGIITISMEFYLGLTYDIANDKAWGEARVTVEIEVLLFSASVTVTMRRQFAGSSGDPPFGELMPQPRWAAYAAAFA